MDGKSGTGWYHLGWTGEAATEIRKVTMCLGSAMDGIVSPNSYVEAVAPNVTVFGDRLFKEVIQVK